MTGVVEEGELTLGDGYRIWYRRVGAGGEVPLLVLHGGPGAGHDYLEPLATLASERPVIFYDQLGCGRSQQPDDPSLWRIERFTGEIDEVRRGLGLDEIHLLGQSWGGWLAIEYMLGRPAGVRRLILANTSASTAQFVAEAAKLKAALPGDLPETLARCEAAGDFHSPEYTAAVMAFYRRHVCRLPEWPDCVNRTVANLEGNQVYETMNGPNEFTVVGTLQGWDREARLGEISLPTLVLVGRHDEIPPACARALHEGIPNSELVIFEASSHMPHLEEPDLFRRVVSGFLGAPSGRAPR